MNARGLCDGKCTHTHTFSPAHHLLCSAPRRGGAIDVTSLCARQVWHHRVARFSAVLYFSSFLLAHKLHVENVNQFVPVQIATAMLFHSETCSYLYIKCSCRVCVCRNPPPPPPPSKHARLTCRRHRRRHRRRRRPHSVYSYTKCVCSLLAGVCMRLILS